MTEGANKAGLEAGKHNIMRNLTLLVYGTLKRGWWNHDQYCGGAISIEAGRVRGRLYELPSGIPVLEVPDDAVLAVGTVDPAADAATQRIVSARLQADLPGGEPIVEGEIIVLGNPRISLPPIDRLEGFIPGGESMYRRVLVTAYSNDGVARAVWVYVGDHRTIRRCRPLNKHSWP